MYKCIHIVTIIIMVYLLGGVTTAFNGEGSKGNELTTSICKIIQNLLKSAKSDRDDTGVLQHMYSCSITNLRFFTIIIVVPILIITFHYDCYNF
jgi:hypothetical protein